MSVFYFLDARTKLFIVFLFTFLVFFVDTFSSVVSLMLLFFIIRITAGIPFKGLKYFKNLTLLALFIILIQTLFGKGENYIIIPLFPTSFPFLGGKGSLNWDGFLFGVIIICRLFTLMMILPVLTQATPLHKITRGLCNFGVNYRAAFIITSALNLIPVFNSEAQVIMDAQRLRGIRKFGIKSYINLLIPLLLNAMQKAQISAVAMDSRAFGVYKTITWLEQPKMKKRDFFFILGSLIFFTVIIYIELECP
ncbi:energy-coupling factor transporter transmembrane component T family protein [Treponema sp. R6D11]